jgi:hypothetical protein
MNLLLLFPVCIGGGALLMAVSHGAQELALRVWEQIDGDGSPRSEDVERGRRDQVVQAARVVALLMVVAFLGAVVITAKVAEDKVRNYPASQLLDDKRQAEVDAAIDSALGPDWRRPVPTWTPAPLIEGLDEALRDAQTRSPTTTAPGIQP